jgi:predicted double-glycine peptidase
MVFTRSVAGILLSIFLGAQLLRSSSGIWLDVPFVRQLKNGCGAASISMLVQYWHGQGIRFEKEIIALTDIQTLLYAEESKGIRGSDMEEYLRSEGFQTFVFAGQWQDLRQQLSQGRPLIVCLGNAGPAGQLHYVVVTGLDEQRRLVLVNDPQGRKLARLHQTRFEKEWDAAGRWTLLALPQKAR